MASTTQKRSTSAKGGSSRGGGRSKKPAPPQKQPIRREVTGFVLLVLGIIGEYLGKIMLCINNTPQYIIRETVNITDKGKEDTDA